jgi:WD40 repeat protein
MSAPETPLRPLPPGVVTEWLQALGAARDSSKGRAAESSLWRLREAAAVLMGFDPATLHPAPAGQEPFDENARLKFFADLEEVEDAPASARWKLANGVRQLTFERFKLSASAGNAQDRMRAALAANPDRLRTPGQQLLETAIEGRVPPLDTLDREQLTVLQSVLPWLQGLVEGLPTIDVLALKVARAELLHPFEQLTGSWFVARQAELARLADHVGILPISGSAGALEGVAQFGRRLAALAARSLGRSARPLFVYGPGGIGKSTLLARFLLDHAQHSDKPLPFIYLDIDSPSVDPLRPLTFISEALRQLQHQLERFGSPARELAAHVLDRLSYGQTSSQESRSDDTQQFIDRFANLVNPYLRERPLILVIDTFEEVQFLGAEAELLVFNLLAGLQKAIPQLRAVLSGRVPPELGAVYQLPLTELPADAAVELLDSVLRTLGKEPPSREFAAEIVATVGGNPMVLRLAARLVAKEDLEGIRDAIPRRERLRRVRDEALEARLYGRVLGHIHDVKVRKLALPGLVVRRITPAVILEVLATPGGIEVSGLEEAQTLLKSMAREVDLVSHDKTDGSLVYRPDIRRVMLSTLESTQTAAIAAEIDTKAVEFWRTRAGPVARAEEIYHRLRLGQAPEVLDPRWDVQAAPLLRSAVGEVEGASRVWLANKLGVSVDKDLRASATQTDWEELVRRGALRLLQAGQPAQALKLLGERSERLDHSTLYALEARALYLLDRAGEARRVATHGLERLQAGGADAPLLIELHLLSALALEKSGDLIGARQEACVALSIAEEAGVLLPALQTQVRILRLDRRITAAVVENETSAPEQDPYRRGRERARVLIAAVGYERISTDSALLCDTAAEVGDIDTDLLQLAVRQMGTEVLQQVRRKRLREILGRVAVLGPSQIERVIQGDLREIAKIAVHALQDALPTGERNSVALTVAAFREASERSVHLLNDTEDEPAAQRSIRGKTNLSARYVRSIKKQIVDTLTPAVLRGLLQVHLSRELEQYVSPSMSFQEQVESLIEGAMAEGWLPALISAVNAAMGRGQAPGWNALGELRGHSDVILRMNWHPSGMYLATASVDCTARIWDVGPGRRPGSPEPLVPVKPTLKELGKLAGHSAGVNQVQWSPDPDAGRIVTCSYDRTIRVWSSGEYRCLLTIEGHSGDVPDVAWSPDGLLLASVSDDGTIALWDSFTGKRRATASRGKGGAPRRLLWLDGGQTVASCWEDGSLCLLPTDRFETAAIREVPGPGGGLIGLAYSPNLGLLAACSSRGFIRIWKYPSLEIVRDLVASTDEVRSVSFTANGEFLAANTFGSDGEVHVWATRDWQESTRFSEPTSEYWPSNIAWDPQGYRLASLTENDSVVRLREMQVMIPVIDRDVAFADVLAEEARLLLGLDIPVYDSASSAGISSRENEERTRRAIDESDTDLAALCLSGGGIRSASFGLGVLQGLARLRLLDRFHYLSSVSGGGYIASWLSAWRHREGDDIVFRKLGALPETGVEPPEISGLRADSNYLTPQLGLLSADTWTVIALYVRNLLLNWLLFLPFFMGCFMLPRLCAGVLMYVTTLSHYPAVFQGARLLGSLSTVVGLGFSVYGRFRRRGSWLTDGGFRWLTLLPLILSGSFFAVAAAAAGTSPQAPSYMQLTPQHLAVGATWGAVIYFIAWSIGRFASRNLTTPAERPIETIDVAFWTLSGALVGVLATTGMIVLERTYAGGDFVHAGRITVVLGLSGFVLAYLIGELFYVGVASFSRKGEMDREWLARSSGWLSAAVVGWTVFSGVALYAPDVLQYGGTQIAALATGGVSGLLTLALGSSSLTAATKAAQSLKSIPLMRLASGAAIIFAILLGSVLALLDRQLENVLLVRDVPHVTSVAAIDALWMLVLILFAVLLSTCININRFSMHALYRNRLVRAFLGSARPLQRRPDPFTGFDPQDNQPLAQTAPAGAPSRLFHVINATLNVVSTDNRAWQERRAESFTMTRLFCGNPFVSYRRTETYGGLSGGGLSLGTAMAISGAAVSPNQGYNSSPLIGFLLMLFNVRLGWWLGSPKKNVYYREGPKFSLSPALRELIGDTTDDSKWIYLSDGGHFDNLGLYEMIRRRCRLIVVSDAGCDPHCTFEDLGNAVRKIYIDFGVGIEFERLEIQPRCNPPAPGMSFAVGTIQYPDSSRPGLLLYLKPTYQGTERLDIRSYANAHSDFPHESTTDQWFTESQLEAYRALGAGTIEHLGNLVKAASRTSPVSGDLKSLIATLANMPSEAEEPSSTRTRYEPRQKVFSP